MNPFNSATFVALAGGLALLPSLAHAQSPTKTGTAAVSGLAAGIDHACMWLEDGSARCWGRNDSAQLGDGTVDDRAVPVRVKGLTDVRKVSLGTTHSCALVKGGTVKCWGQNRSGQLGDGTTDGREIPVTVKNLTEVTDIAAGHQFTCALRKAGTVHCWGFNAYGQLGNGGRGSRAKPTKVLGILTAREVDVGGGHACARLADGSVRCWGRNDWGQLGIGKSGKRAHQSRPGPVAGLMDAAELEVGFGQGCAMFTGGNLMCWGGGDQGQLGNGRSKNAVVPEHAKYFTRTDNFSMSGGHTCAIADGNLNCIGANHRGQLGIGRFTKRRRKPAKKPALSGAREVVTGGEFTCALSYSGRVFCFGEGKYGQLGDGAKKRRATASPVALDTPNRIPKALKGESDRLPTAMRN